MHSPWEHHLDDQDQPSLQLGDVVLQLQANCLSAQIDLEFIIYLIIFQFHFYLFLFHAFVLYEHCWLVPLALYMTGALGIARNIQVMGSLQVDDLFTISS